MKKSFSELREQRMAANEKLGDLYAKAQNREPRTARSPLSVRKPTRVLTSVRSSLTSVRVRVIVRLLSHLPLWVLPRTLRHQVLST